MKKNAIQAGDFRISPNPDGSLELYYRTTSGNLYKKDYSSRADFEENSPKFVEEQEARDLEWVKKFQDIEDNFHVEDAGKLAICKKVDADDAFSTRGGMKIGEVIIWQDKDGGKGNICVLQKIKQSTAIGYDGFEYHEISPTTNIDIRAEVERFARQGLAKTSSH